MEKEVDDKEESPNDDTLGKALKESLKNPPVRNTQIRAISVSNEFSEMIEKYNLSPTEIFRVGMAVTLYEIGESPYNNQKNRERYEILKKILTLRELDESLESAEKSIREIRNTINKISDKEVL